MYSVFTKLKLQIGSEVHWKNEPAVWKLEEELISIEPAAETDLFRRFQDTPVENACFLHAVVKGDFTLSAWAELEGAGPYDAAALLVMADHENWAKLCIERSPAGAVSIVSVVTHPWSDDANGEILEQPKCWLRMSRKGRMMGMQYSVDGKFWHFVRVYGWEFPDELKVGISAQSPKGLGARARFKDLHVSRKPVDDLRNGTQ